MLYHMAYAQEHNNHNLPYDIWLSKIFDEIKAIPKDIKDNEKLKKDDYFKKEWLESLV